MRSLLIGLVAVVGTLAGIFGARLLTAPGDAGGKQAKAVVLETVKLDVVSVPIIRDGELQGYAIVRAALTAAGADVKAGGDMLLAYGTESVLRVFHEDTTLDFKRLKPVQLAALAERIATYTNARMGRAVVSNAVVEGLSFVAKGGERATRPD